MSKRILCAVALVAASGTANAQLPTTGSIDSPLGKLEVKNGFPTAPTAAKLYDNLDFNRAVQAYLWGLPLVAMGQWQDEQREKFGAGTFDYVDYIDFKDKLGLLTSNATTPYTIAFLNLERTGPLVFEFPAAPFAGGIVDFWQRPVTDTGALGPDRMEGAKYLILGPTHKDIKPEGYLVFRCPTNNVWCGQRALAEHLDEAKATLAGMRIYPYAQRDNPPATRHSDPAGRQWSGEQPRGLEYWQLLSRLINDEPVHERDRMILAMLVPLGIEKGKPFQPDERQRKILAEGANVGELTARAIGYAKRFPAVRIWEGTHWEYALFLKETNQETPTHTQLDERTSWFYEAVGVSVAMLGRTLGAGQVYLSSSKDATGAYLDGGKHYTLRLPKDPPVKQFWSFTIYDNESRCMIDTGTYPDRSSRQDIQKNADGSVDLYFGPTPPAGKPASNWIKTLPGRGWFTYFRLYAPTQPYFDKTWRLPDIQILQP